MNLSYLLWPVSELNSLLLQVTHYLGGENYVFWGGREGYQTLLNTDMERELNHMVSHQMTSLVINFEFKIQVMSFHTF